MKAILRKIKPIHLFYFVVSISTIIGLYSIFNVLPKNKPFPSQLAIFYFTISPFIALITAVSYKWLNKTSPTFQRLLAYSVTLITVMALVAFYQGRGSWGAFWKIGNGYW